MKKKIILSLIIIAILLAAIVGAIFYVDKNNYTYDEALELLNPQITNNMSVIITETNPSGDNYKEEFYRKDKVSYEKFSNGDNALHEILYNLETLEQNNIIHYSKEYYNLSIEDPSLDVIGARLSFFNTLMKEGITTSYTFYGKEKIQDADCIKFSIDYTSDYFLGNEYPVRLYYYLNIDESRLEKLEYYNTSNATEHELLTTMEFYYSYDTVTDENILKYDANNYSDYSFIASQS